MGWPTRISKFGEFLVIFVGNTTVPPRCKEQQEVLERENQTLKQVERVRKVRDGSKPVVNEDIYIYRMMV